MTGVGIGRHRGAWGHYTDLSTLSRSTLSPAGAGYRLVPRERRRPVDNSAEPRSSGRWRFPAPGPRGARPPARRSGGRSCGRPWDWSGDLYGDGDVYGDWRALRSHAGWSRPAPGAEGDPGFVRAGTIPPQRCPGRIARHRIGVRAASHGAAPRRAARHRTAPPRPAAAGSATGYPLVFLPEPRSVGAMSEASATAYPCGSAASRSRPQVCRPQPRRKVGDPTAAAPQGSCLAAAAGRYAPRPSWHRASQSRQR